MEGAVERLRPVIMTVSAIIAGLLPIMWATETGSQVMKRIAAPMVGGMISAALLTLIILPTLYYIWRSWQLHRTAPKEASELLEQGGGRQGSRAKQKRMLGGRRV